MELQCECGENVELPPGQSEVECPECGRTVRSGRDWLAGLDEEELAIDEPVPEETEPEPEPEPGPPPSREAEEPEAEPTGEQEQEAPTNLLAVARLAYSEPEEALDWLRRGIKSPALMKQLAVAFVALAFLGAAARSYLVAAEPGPYGNFLSEFVRNFVSLFVELGAATGFFWLLCMGFKPDPVDRPNPLGVVEGMVALRVAAMVVLMPVALVLMLAVMGAGRGGLIGDVGSLIRTWYMLLLFVGHGLVMVPLFDAGCGKGFLFSLVVTYCGYFFAHIIAP